MQLKNDVDLEELSNRLERFLETSRWEFRDSFVWSKVFKGKRHYFLWSNGVHVMPDLRYEGVKQKELSGEELFTFLRKEFQSFLQENNMSIEQVLENLKAYETKMEDEYILFVNNRKK